MKELQMYGGAVKLVFNPDSPRYRYTITDEVTGAKDVSMRGVTTVLRDIIHKPDLMQWPMNMSHQHLFGQTFDEPTKEYIYNPDKAVLKPGTEYTEEQLAEFMVQGRKAHTKRSNKGKDVGTLTHRMVELYLEGDKTPGQTAIGEHDDLDDENIEAAANAYKAFVEYWESLPNKEILHLERPVYSRSLQFAGTVDIVAKIDGKTYLIDIKTTNSSGKAPLGIYAEYFVQLGGYAHALKEELGINFDDLVIIRASKEGKVDVASAYGDMRLPVQECERAFAFAVRLHDWLETTSQYLTDRNFKTNFFSSEQVDKQSSDTLKEE